MADTVNELRDLEIRIAKAVGYSDDAEHSCLLNPEGRYLEGVFTTPENRWRICTPKFASSMDQAELLLRHLLQQFGIEYVLFSDNSQHTCEIGHWAKEADEHDDVWSASAPTMALAVVKAVETCEIVMGVRPI